MEELIRLRLDELNRLRQDLIHKQKKDLQRIDVRMQDLTRHLGDKEHSFGQEDEITAEMNLPFELDEDESLPKQVQDEAVVMESHVSQGIEFTMDETENAQVAQITPLQIVLDETQCCDETVSDDALDTAPEPDMPELPGMDEEDPVVEAAGVVDSELAAMMGEEASDMPELPGMDEEDPVVEAAGVVDSELAAMMGEEASDMPELPGMDDDELVVAVPDVKTSPSSPKESKSVAPKVTVERVVLPPDLELAITENESLLENHDDQVVTPIASQATAKASEEDIDALVKGMFA
ncbi:MAG: hypothetical protein AABZ14_03515 [Candidatus Margulisiibacteriota bacterium]